MLCERTKWLLAVAGLTVALCVIQPGAAQSTPKWSLLALSKRDHTLAIVDPATLKIIARLPVGPDPHEVIASSDGTKAYVSIYGFGRYHALSAESLTGWLGRIDISGGVASSTGKPGHVTCAIAVLSVTG
jgi:DNA-binding beta-propeller fold protein YncE